MLRKNCSKLFLCCRYVCFDLMVSGNPAIPCCFRANQMQNSLHNYVSNIFNRLLSFGGRFGDNGGRQVRVRRINNRTGCVCLDLEARRPDIAWVVLCRPRGMRCRRCLPIPISTVVGSPFSRFRC